MKSALLLLTTISVGMLPASAASAAVSGRWHVSGKVSSFAFTLNCDFKPEGSTLGGTCTDASTSDPKVSAGKSHAITGSVDGDKVHWAYQASFLLTKFNVTYSGVLSGDHIGGTIDAQGRKGTFTASKQ